MSRGIQILNAALHAYMSEHSTTLFVCVCGKPGIFACAKCNVARYCSRECQIHQWAAHRAHCGQFPPAMSAVEAAALTILHTVLEASHVLVAGRVPAEMLPRAMESIKMCLSSFPLEPAGHPVVTKIRETLRSSNDAAIRALAG